MQMGGIHTRASILRRSSTSAARACAPDRTARPSRVAALGISLTMLVGIVAVAPAAHAVGPCDPPSNPIVCENSKPGTPEFVWNVNGIGDPLIQGFATQISVNHGQTVKFKI
jgi:hypothetical protein